MDLCYILIKVMDPLKRNVAINIRNQVSIIMVVIEMSAKPINS